MKFLCLAVFMSICLQNAIVISLGHSLRSPVRSITSTSITPRLQAEHANPLTNPQVEPPLKASQSSLGFSEVEPQITCHLPQCEGISLTKNFRQCRKTDPAVGKCLRGALQDAFKKMKNVGIPSLGVLPMEPLLVNDILIDPGAGGPVTLKLHFKNLKMYGIPDSNITEYRANFNDARLTTTALTSKLWFEADYNADGKVLLLPVKGSGKCNVTLFDLKTTTDLKFHPENKNGETYWIIQSFRNKFTPKKVTVYFDGLLKGERRLNSGINQFLNDNWKIVFEELGPSFEDAFGAVFKEITHRVFSRVPVNKIFLN